MLRRESPGVSFETHDGERRKGCPDGESATERRPAAGAKPRGHARPETPTVDLGIAGWRVPIHSHIAYPWETDREFAEAVEFVEAGLRGSDHCVVVGDRRDNKRILAILERRGLGTGRLRNRKRPPEALARKLREALRT